MKEQILGLVVAVLAASVPVVRAWLKSKVSDRIWKLESVARTAVQGAEQLSKLLPPAAVNDVAAVEALANKKLDYAADVVVSGAKRLGFKLTRDEVLAYVHSALHEMQTPQPQL